MSKVKSTKPWTPARKHSFIVSILRQGSRKYPPIFEALNAAKTEKKVNVLTGRLAQHYRCAWCGSDFSAKMVQVDHILPVTCPEKGFESWDMFIKRLYCDTSNLQVLCKPCHLEKSRSETKERIKK